jgi:restriction system protein
VELNNGDLDEQVSALEQLLADSLKVDPYLNLDTLKVPPTLPTWSPGLLQNPEPPPAPAPQLPPPKGIHRLSGKAKDDHTRAVAAQEAAFRHALFEHSQREQNRQATLAAAWQDHLSLSAQVQADAATRDAELDQLKRDLDAADPEAIRTYFGIILHSTNYPEQIRPRARLAYVPESKQLVIEYELPQPAVVPEVAAYKYVRSGDKVATTARPLAQRKVLYAGVIAQVTLRSLREIFVADRWNHIETIVFNGHADTINPGTGHPEHPCLITVRTSRDLFTGLDLSRVDPIACLKTLNASVSKSPAELSPVRPILEFNMVDPRFIDQTDVISELDQRPNLMELTPSEFEQLITNLFERMGLETRLTQASRDGGVDCVAYDPRPIFGGKVVIQAKRYKHTVGVSAVRDLFGTMQNEGATKGILVTTSGYGKASYEFADGKPLELLHGSNLLFLLAEHAGIEAKIQPPEDWKDPTPDSGDPP